MNQATTPVKGAAVEARPGVDARPGAAAFRAGTEARRDEGTKGEEGRKIQPAKAASNGALVADQMSDEQRVAVRKDWVDDFLAAARSARCTITRSVPSWVNAHLAMRDLREAGAQCYGTERSVTVVSVAISGTEARSDAGAKGSGGANE